jgi:hypothetical protein
MGKHTKERHYKEHTVSPWGNYNLDTDINNARSCHLRGKITCFLKIVTDMWPWERSTCPWNMKKVPSKAKHQVIHQIIRSRKKKNTWEQHEQGCRQLKLVTP